LIAVTKYLCPIVLFFLLIQADLCVVCMYFYFLRPPLARFLVRLQCLPRAAGVPLESALNLVSRMCPCGARATHFGVLGVKIACSIFEMIELMIRVFIEVRITSSSQDNQVPAVRLYLMYISHLLLPSKQKVT